MLQGTRVCESTAQSLSLRAVVAVARILDLYSYPNVHVVIQRLRSEIEGSGSDTPLGHTSTPYSL